MIPPSYHHISTRWRNISSTRLGLKSLLGPDFLSHSWRPVFWWLNERQGLCWCKTSSSRNQERVLVRPCSCGLLWTGQAADSGQFWRIWSSCFYLWTAWVWVHKRPPTAAAGRPLMMSQTHDDRKSASIQVNRDLHTKLSHDRLGWGSHDAACMKYEGDIMSTWSIFTAVDAED